MEELREMKGPEELTAMRRALELSEAVLAGFPGVGPRKDGAPGGLGDRKGLAGRGGRGPAFSPIVAGGANSAGPHPQPGDQVITGEPVIIDMGGGSKAMRRHHPHLYPGAAG